MKKIWKAAALLMAALMTVGTVTAQAAGPALLVNDGPKAEVTESAAAGSTGASAGTTYVSLGADLSGEQRAEVLRLLGLTEADLAGIKVITVTNAEEHEYLDAYLDESVIGTHALSSCKITSREAGHGIVVETHNITYVTPAMYENALATAGMKNADVVVAGPFNLSGTAALIGAMKAYQEQTGEIISPQLLDGATDELVTTGQIAESLEDPEKAAQLIATVKQIMAENDISSEEDLGEAVDDVARQMEISLSAEDRQLILDLLEKLSQLDLDARDLTSQAQNIYDQIRGMDLDLEKYGITQESVTGFLGQFSGLINAVLSWLRGRFGV